MCTNDKHSKELCNIKEWKPGPSNSREDLVVSWDEPIRPSAIVYRFTFTCRPNKQKSCSSCDSWKITFWQNSSSASDGSDSSETENTTEVAIHCNRFYRAMLCVRGTSHGPVSVCVRVRLSVTSRSSTKTAKRRITQTTPHDSTGTLVF